MTAPERKLAISLFGAQCHVPDHWTVAAAILLQSEGWSRRSRFDGGPRAPFCMMGACFDCLVIVDGKRDVRACLTPVAEGMVVEHQDDR